MKNEESYSDTISFPSYPVIIVIIIISMSQFSFNQRIKLKQSINFRNTTLKAKVLSKKYMLVDCDYSKIHVTLESKLSS